jgi:hypothetical protein
VIPDERVRGRTPPPWFHALTDIERMRAVARGPLPWPPLARLLGLRTTHVAAGTVTVAMPATEASLAGNGQLQVVSSTVKDLAVGSTIRFTDRGEQTLKGVPDPWRLYAVADA